jgi:hypothetical protein
MITRSFLRSPLHPKRFNSYPRMRQIQWLSLYRRCSFSWPPCSPSHGRALTRHRRRNLPALLLQKTCYSRLVLPLQMDKNKGLSLPSTLQNQRSDLVSCWSEAVLDEGCFVLSLTSTVLRVCLEFICIQRRLALTVHSPTNVRSLRITKPASQL